MKNSALEEPWVSQIETTIIIIALLASAVGFRLWRAMREQRIKVAWMWVGPALVAAIVVWVFVIDGLGEPLDIVLAVIALALGVATGLYQGTHTTVRADRTAGVLYVKIRPIAAAIVLVVIVARILLRTSYVLPAIQNGSMAGGAMPLPPKGDAVSVISAMLLVFALGAISGLRMYLFGKYRASDTPVPS